MTTKYRREVEEIASKASSGVLRMAYLELITLGIRLGLEGAAAVEGCEDSEEGVEISKRIRSLNPLSLLEELVK